MDPNKLRDILQAVSLQRLAIEEAMERLRFLPYEDIGIAMLDTHRSLRKGIPEVVFCEGKSVDQIILILERLSTHHEKILATRVSSSTGIILQDRFPSGRYEPVSRLFMLPSPSKRPEHQNKPYIAVISAGTSDLPVAEEAAQTIEFLGGATKRFFDIGIAGLHRLMDKLEDISRASAVIAVAGMEGALPSVIAGLVTGPVIGVPTSVGYGSGLGGFTALFAMLNSCTPGVSVVNIDNGFGAGICAHLILQQQKKG